MAPTLRAWLGRHLRGETPHEHGLGAVIEEIERLGSLERGWNSYGAGPVPEAPRRRAIRFVESLPDLGTRIPAPTVTPTSNDGVALHWQANDYEVEIIFSASRDEYSVARISTDEVLEEGPLSRVDLLKDVVGRYVIRR